MPFLRVWKSWGSVDLPPCIQQRSLPETAGFLHRVPCRVFARQRLTDHRCPKRVPRPNSINFSVLTIFNMIVLHVHGVMRHLKTLHSLACGNFISRIVFEKVNSGSHLVRSRWRRAINQFRHSPDIDWPETLGSHNCLKYYFINFGSNRVAMLKVGSRNLCVSPWL